MGEKNFIIVLMPLSICASNLCCVMLYMLTFLCFSAYTICSPMVRSDGTVTVSVGVMGSKEEKKASERLVSPAYEPLCESESILVSICCNMKFNQCIFFLFQTVHCSRAFYTVKELLDSEAQ